MDLEFAIDCPTCNRTVKLKLRKLKKGSSHPCPHCRTSVIINDDDFRKAQKAVDDFEKGIKS